MCFEMASLFFMASQNNDNLEPGFKELAIMWYARKVGKHKACLWLQGFCQEVDGRHLSIYFEFAKGDSLLSNKPDSC